MRCRLQNARNVEEVGKSLLVALEGRLVQISQRRDVAAGFKAELVVGNVRDAA